MLIFLFVCCKIVSMNNNRMEVFMKVFISWSGTKSHKVALVFREWLPSVIQSIEPYVSSEDIDKGARWSTDIAKELENSTFGILCVTKENLNAPWLSFEAGALSKTIDKSFVTPFLIDIKRSEVNGPILQFQSTVFEKEDIKKLIQTLNKACGENGISELMLERAFDVWYPSLKDSLDELNNLCEEKQEEITAEVDEYVSPIIEEILELSRDNQKLLRNSDIKVLDSIEDIRQRVDHILYKSERSSNEHRMTRKKTLMFVEQLLHEVLPTCQTQYGFMIVLNSFQIDFPWLYNIGKALVDLLQTDATIEKKLDAINECRYLIDFTYDHILRFERKATNKEQDIIIREQQMMLRDILFDILQKMEYDVNNSYDLQTSGSVE